MKKRTHCLLYHPRVSVKFINPVVNLDQLITFVNADRTNKNLLAKTVRLNWMVKNLKHEPIYKPLLTVLRAGKLVTATGDTRLQAIELNPHITYVSCLVSLPLELQENFKYWDTVVDQKNLAAYLNIDIDDIIVNKDWNRFELDWIEFALPDTAKHMHDEEQRLRMINNYLITQPKDFKFSREWFKTAIDWNQYDF